MYEYIGFKAEKFLKDSRKWDEELAGYVKELEEITLIKGESDSVGHSTEISRPVESLAVRRDKVVSKINRVRAKQNLLAYCLKRLSQYDYELICGFFYNKGPTYKFVELWCDKHEIGNREYCYRDRRIALEHLSEVAEGYLRSHGYDV